MIISQVEPNLFTVCSRFAFVHLASSDVHVLQMHFLLIQRTHVNMHKMMKRIERRYMNERLLLPHSIFSLAIAKSTPRKMMTSFVLCSPMCKSYCMMTYFIKQMTKNEMKKDKKQFFGYYQYYVTCPILNCWLIVMLTVAFAGYYIRMLSTKVRLSFCTLVV